ncbi:MAG: acyl-CoA thioesterase [Paenibacillaceae bacterium]|nr:acyl-CoA thioesterase [Paenibacillaceae bacterium]
MAEQNAHKLINVSGGGPAAPKDPAGKRSSLYLMYESEIEATTRSGGKHSQEIYLEDGRLVNKARLTGGVAEEEILELLGSTAGFRQLVHSIGVSVKIQGDAPAPVQFVMEHWGKTAKYESGTRLGMLCSGDGGEALLELETVAWSGDDDVPGKFAFEFPAGGMLAAATVVLYLQDGYEVPELALETPVDASSAEYRDMIARSLLSAGNNLRLKSAIGKAKQGGDVTIAYIGGSITQGAGSKPIHTHSYAYLSYLRFKELYGTPGKDHIHFIKAGVGGTPSELGVVRYERDILRHGTVKPDIVVVEFAVNDAGDETEGNCFESLCLTILGESQRPAVVLLFSVFADDWNLQDRLAPVGERWGLPMVSIKDAVTGQFCLSKAAGNVISKRQYFYDIYHPTNAGHQVMADCLARLFEQTDLAALGPEEEDGGMTAAIGNDFVGMRLLDRSNWEGIAEIDHGDFVAADTDLQMVEMDDQPYGTPQFPHNWMRPAGSGSAPFRMTIICKSLILVFKDSGSSAMGSADILVDGQWLRVADPHENNWTHCNPALLIQEKQARKHSVEIRMAEGQDGRAFTILGFGYVPQLGE